MKLKLIFLLLVLVIFSNCGTSVKDPKVEESHLTKEALLTTEIQSFEALKKEVLIEYFGDTSSQSAWVRLSHACNDRVITGILEQGISEGDLNNARVGSFSDRLSIGFKSPFAIANRAYLKRIMYLARRRVIIFGAGDVAFYDLASQMVANIQEVDKQHMTEKALSEKGYLNTFNHITAQALMTCMKSESVADYIADVHERQRLPELVTGHFSEEQLDDIENGAVDNYVDMVNNEWGQELGKKLKAKYQISEMTIWTPELLANFLNDIQSYYSWSFNFGMDPFRPTDDLIVRYSKKINLINSDSIK